MITFRQHRAALLLPPTTSAHVASRRLTRFDTGGGTSDARFLTRLCPVAEFGLVGRTMHQADECVAVADLETLTIIYQRLLAAFFP